MLQYDLTHTRLFEAPTRATLPTEAELFVVTAALLLVNDTSYSAFDRDELNLTQLNVDAVAVSGLEHFRNPIAVDLEGIIFTRLLFGNFAGSDFQLIQRWEDNFLRHVPYYFISQNNNRGTEFLR